MANDEVRCQGSSLRSFSRNITGSQSLPVSDTEHSGRPEITLDPPLVTSEITEASSASFTVILRALTTGVWILAGLATVFALQWARPVLVPILFGVLLSYILDPIVSGLVVRGVPRAIAAPVIVVSLAVSLGAAAYTFRGQANALLVQLPGAAQDLRRALQARGVEASAMTDVQKAADELHQLGAPKAVPPNGQVIPRVQVEPKSFEVTDLLWSGSAALVHFAANAIVVVILALYLLVAGDLFRRRAIEFAGPTLTKKKITLQILNDISAQISSYLFLRTVISLTVASLTTLVLWLAGLAQPVVWGAVAGVLNIVPYFGPIAAVAMIGSAGFLQFHSLGMAAVVTMLTTVVACLESYVLAPLLTSRTAALNPVAVFIGLIFWGWLWGLAGLLLAVPLLMITKTISEHFDGGQLLLALLKR